LEPVSGLRKRNQFRLGAIAEAVLSHFEHEKAIAPAPENASGDTDGAIRKGGPMAQSSAVPVNHRGHGARLRPGGAVEVEVLGRESAGAAGTRERSDGSAEIGSGEKKLRQERQLKKENVPALAALKTVVEQVAAHDRGMRNVENGEFVEALGMQ